MTNRDDDMNNTVRMAPVVPIYAATAPIKRGPGRPKKVNPRPTVDDLIYHSAMAEERKHFIESDTLVGLSEQKKESLDVLYKIKQEVSREAAALLFQRNENEKYGKDSSQISSRRIAALKDIAAIELEIKKVTASMLDLRNEKVQKVFAMFIETIRKTAQEVLPPEQFDLLFNRLETDLDGWEERAEDLIR